MKTTHVQSLVGVGNTDLGMLGAVGLGRKQQRDEPAVVRWNGWSYLVDAGVEHYARPVERMDFLRLSDGAELRALTYKAWYDLLRDLPEARRQIAVMVGLPVEVMGNTDLARTTRRELRRWMQGEHIFSVDGEPMAVTVARVEVMAQPAGAFYAWGFDDRGAWMRSQADQQAIVGIADIGFNTLDLFTVQGGRIQGRFTDGDSLGMRRAAEMVIQAVKREYAVTLSKHQADALVRDRRAEMLLTGRTVDLSGIVSQAFNSNAGAVTTFLEEKWGNGRQFGYLIFTGGGATALRDVLLRHYPHGIIMPDAVLTNAIGLARAGYRVLGTTAPYVVGLDPGYGGFKAVRLPAE